MCEKLTKLREQRYAEPGIVTSLMNMFDVPKEEHNIRMVYDGTKSEFNKFMRAPWFPLPTIDRMLRRTVSTAYWLGDNDIGN